MMMHILLSKCMQTFGYFKIILKFIFIIYHMHSHNLWLDLQIKNSKQNTKRKKNSTKKKNAKRSEWKVKSILKSESMQYSISSKGFPEKKNQFKSIWITIAMDIIRVRTHIHHRIYKAHEIDRRPQIRIGMFFWHHV